MWDENHNNELEILKHSLTSAPVLVLFDPAKSHKVSADSSRGGLGAVLLQLEVENDWHPVAYASRSMTGVEQEYLQIEKEALAILFSV